MPDVLHGITTVLDKKSATGNGLTTVNTSAVEVPPPGPELVTVKFLAPSVALDAMVILAVIKVSPLTVLVFTVMSAPPTFTVDDPLINPPPLKSTFSVCPCVPCVGLMLYKLGVGFICPIWKSPKVVNPFTNSYPNEFTPLSAAPHAPPVYCCTCSFASIKPASTSAGAYCNPTE